MDVFKKRADKHVGFYTESKKTSPRRRWRAAAKISERIFATGAIPAGF
jgi:hypothetical protein